MRHRFLKSRRPRLGPVVALAVGVAAAGVAGCERDPFGTDMYNQPRYNPQQANDFFQDGQSARPLVTGTVPRDDDVPDRSSQPVQRDALPGAAAPTGEFPPGFPTEGDALRHRLARGQRQYNIHCSVCHGYTGLGDGMIVQRGFAKPPSFVLLERDRTQDIQRFKREEFLQTAPASHVYNAITNGFGSMYSYADRVKPADRWAIAAYVKVLQQAKPETTTAAAVSGAVHGPAEAKHP